MLLYLICLNVFHPLQLLEQVKVIRWFRKAQETLRTSENPIAAPCIRQIQWTAEKSELSEATVTSIIEDWFYKRPLPLVFLCRRAGLRTIMRRLYIEGFVLGVFSDYPATGKIRALGISEWITTVVSSCDAEVEGFKPHTNGFSVAAMRMGIDPSHILYVGDRPEVDGMGGLAARMNVAILNGNSVRGRPHSYPRLRSFRDIVRVIHHYG